MKKYKKRILLTLFLILFVLFGYFLLRHFYLFRNTVLNLRSDDLSVAKIDEDNKKGSIFTQTTQRNLEKDLIPIRISYNKDEIQSILAEQNQIVFQQAIDTAINFFAQFVKVKSQINKFKILKQTCSNFKITEEEKNANLHLFIEFSFKLDSSIAYSTPCILSPKDFRPVVGLMGFNLLYLKRKNITSFEFYELKLTIIHELFHILAFHPALFKLYKLSQSADQYYSLEQNWVSFPQVVKWAQQHFNCSKIDRIFLENNGGQGTASTHWERSILWNDLMTSTLKKDDIVWSGINNSLLEDTGWYSVDLNYHDELYWGKHKGCSFYFDLCTSTQKFEEFCDQSQVGMAMTGFTYGGIGICSKGDSFIDKKCAVVSQPSETQCKNTKNQFNQIGIDLTQYGSTFDWNSKSFYSTLIPWKIEEFIESKVQCYKSECLYEDKIGKQINIYLQNNPSPLVCLNDLQKINLYGYYGQLICPNIEDFCNKLIECNNFCNNGGFCKDRKCVCTPGTSGPDCQCQYGYFWNSQQCVKCSEKHCLKCNSNDNCLECQSSYILHSNSSCLISPKFVSSKDSPSTFQNYLSSLFEN